MAPNMNPPGEKLTIPITFLIFDKRDNLSSDINSGLAVINDNTPEDVVFVAEIIRRDSATEFEYYSTIAGKKCCRLAAWNVRNMGFEPQLPKLRIGYYLLWKLLPGDKECAAAETSWPMAGLNRRSTSSAPYNVHYWNTVRWENNITWGTSVIIHEVFFMLSLTLADKNNCGLSYSTTSHEYGSNLPFIDSWTSFGYQADNAEWERWCYKQLTYDMCQKLHEIASTAPPPPIPPPAYCKVNVIRDGYKITFDGTTYSTPKSIFLPVTEEKEYGKPPVYVGQKSITFERGGAGCDTIIKVIRDLPEVWTLDENIIPMCLENFGLKYKGTKDSLDIILASSFLYWMQMKGGGEGIGLYEIIDIIRAYRGKKDIGFMPTLDNIIKVLRYYRQGRPS